MKCAEFLLELYAPLGRVEIVQINVVRAGDLLLDVLRFPVLVHDIHTVHDIGYLMCHEALLEYKDATGAGYEVMK